MVDINTPINKVIVIVVIASIAPTAMIAFNNMNTTGFSAEQIAIVGLMGLVISFGFLRMVMQD